MLQVPCPYMQTIGQTIQIKLIQIFLQIFTITSMKEKNIVIQYIQWQRIPGSSTEGTKYFSQIDAGTTKSRMSH
jgi:hypothetical protein